MSSGIEITIIFTLSRKYRNVDPRGHRKIRVYDCCIKIVSDYDQEIPQLQTADKPMAPLGTATQQSP